MKPTTKQQLADMFARIHNMCMEAQELLADIEGEDLEEEALEGTQYEYMYELEYVLDELEAQASELDCEFNQY